MGLFVARGVFAIAFLGFLVYYCIARDIYTRKYTGDKLLGVGFEYIRII